MKQAGPITDALKLPSGARFYRCAFQVNPHHYVKTYRGADHGLSEAEYIEAILQKCLALDVRVLGVTDHNHVGAIDTIREAASRHGITVFPGFEVGSAEGVHTLCLYPPDATVESLGRYLGQLGIHCTQPQSDLSTLSFSELLATVRQQGGITIAAHVTQPSGLLTQLHGQARAKAWKDPNLLAVQIPGDVDSVPPDKINIIRNKDPEYRRVPSAATNLAIAVVNAGDVARPDDLDDPGTTTYVKMSGVSIEGLRQAFLDPASRVRLNSDEVPDEHTEFLAVAWQGGFLDESAIHFNENLNVLIGGRGTGKSTVIESLRYVLGLEPLGEEARKAYDGILKQVLRSGTKISLLVRSHRPSKREYLIERTVPNPPVVRDESGNVLTLTPSDVVGQAEVYGQHEISELTKSREKLTRLLERFVERDAALERRKRELRRELERSRGRILEVSKELRQVEERLTSLPTLEETLKRFQEAGLEERLKEQSLLVREERILKTCPERLAPFREIVEQLRRALPIDRTFLSAKALEDLPGKDTISKANDVLDQLSKELEQIATQMSAALDRADQGVGAVNGKWQERKKIVQAAYEKILRELQKSKVDGEEFIRLRHQIEELRPLKERQTALRRDEKGARRRATQFAG
jgi:PHP family Zn ribbon phosphoesterase